MMIAMTAAKIGRLMKNSENDIGATLFVAGLWGCVRCRRRRGSGFRGRRCGYRSARLHLEQIIDHDLVAGIEAREYRPVLPDPVSGRDRPRLRFPVGVDDENEVAFFCLDNRGLRHEKDLVALARSDANGDELSRKKLLARIVEFGAQLLRTEPRIDRGRRKVEPALEWIQRAVL